MRYENRAKLLDGKVTVYGDDGLTPICVLTPQQALDLTDWGLLNQVKLVRAASQQAIEQPIQGRQEHTQDDHDRR